MLKLLHFDLLYLHSSNQKAHFSAPSKFLFLIMPFSCNLVLRKFQTKIVHQGLCIISLTKNSLINTKYVLVPNQLC